MHGRPGLLRVEQQLAVLDFLFGQRHRIPNPQAENRTEQVHERPHLGAVGPAGAPGYISIAQTIFSISASENGKRRSVRFLRRLQCPRRIRMAPPGFLAELEKRPQPFDFFS